MKWLKRKRTYFVGKIDEPVASISPEQVHQAPFGWAETGLWEIYIFGSRWGTAEYLQEAMEKARQELKQRGFALVDIGANLKDDWEEWKP